MRSSQTKSSGPAAKPRRVPSRVFQSAERIRPPFSKKDAAWSLPARLAAHSKTNCFSYVYCRLFHLSPGGAPLTSPHKTSASFSPPPAPSKSAHSAPLPLSVHAGPLYPQTPVSSRPSPYAPASPAIAIGIVLRPYQYHGAKPDSQAMLSPVPVYRRETAPVPPALLPASDSI